MSSKSMGSTQGRLSRLASCETSYNCPVLKTPIYDKQIAGPMAWTGEDGLAKEDFVFKLGPSQIAALRELLTRVQDVPRDEITAEMCRQPDLDEFLEDVYEELVRGRGLAVIRGVPIDPGELAVC